MKRCAYLLVVLVILVGPPTAAAATLTETMQGIIDEFLAGSPQAPGVVVHILSPSRGLDTTLVAGRSANGPDAPALTADQTFRIASNTKTYVAAAALRLVEQGRLGLDDTLADHLPIRYRDLLAGDGYDLAAMTIAQALTHTSGLFEHPADPRYAAAIVADPHRVWTRDEQVRLCVEWGDPVGTPGEKFVYSDTGYILLGAVIEEITGVPLGLAVHQLLDYERLGLRATWWELAEPAPATAGPRAHQYYDGLDTFDWHPSLDLYGGGGLLTDAADLARFLAALLDGQVFAEAPTLVQMTGRGTLAYRCGLMRDEMSGHLAWGHTGFWNTFAFQVPSLDLTVAGAVLSHHAVRGRELAARLVAAVAAGDSGREGSGVGIPAR